jgi:hypothetical protein
MSLEILIIATFENSFGFTRSQSLDYWTTTSR